MLVSAGIAHSVPDRAAALVSTVVLAGSAYILARPAVGDPFRYVGFRGAGARLILLTLAASLALILPALSLEALTLLRFKVPQEIEDALNRLISARTVPELVYVLTVAAVAAAFCEEFVFRGILQQSLASRLGGWAVILTAVVFALLHTIWRTPPAFVLGLFLGFLYWRTRSLVLPVLAHFTINTVSILAAFVVARRGEAAMPRWVIEETPAPWWMTLVSLAVFAAAFRALWRAGAPAPAESAPGTSGPPGTSGLPGSPGEETLASGGRPPDIPLL